MKHILFYSISLVLFSGFLFSQEKESVKDSIKQKERKKYSSIFIGIDLFSPSYSIFSNKKGMKGFLQYQNKERLAMVLEMGYEQNIYDRINWLSEVYGPYVSVGINYFIVVDKQENIFNGFYTGMRLANSFYKQEIKQYPIYGNSISDLLAVGSLESANVNSTWVEIMLGARADIIKHKLYADVSFRPKIHVYSTKQENIKPLVIPGFGINQSNLNFDVLFGLSYEISLRK